MFALKKGTFRLFRAGGIEVFLHWSWFVVAAWDLSARREAYGHRAWHVAEYLAIFGIILLHEFGHALACRSVGGQADRIVLWPLGGVAFVRPPARPGALLWSIAAGPLVNVALAAILVPAWFLLANPWDLDAPTTDAISWLTSLTIINLGLLAFNLLPIYPLDGGQILQSLLWFVVGRPWSLIVAGTIGVLAGLAAIPAALSFGAPFPAALAAFVAWIASGGVRQGLALRRFEGAGRREGLSCPSCKAAPPIGPFWICKDCRTKFDTFREGGICPSCSTPFAETACTTCGRRSPILAWHGGSLPADAV